MIFCVPTPLATPAQRVSTSLMILHLSAHAWLMMVIWAPKQFTYLTWSFEHLNNSHVWLMVIWAPKQLTGCKRGKYQWQLQLWGTLTDLSQQMLSQGDHSPGSQCTAYEPGQNFLGHTPLQSPCWTPHSWAYRQHQQHQVFRSGMSFSCCQLFWAKLSSKSSVSCCFLQHHYFKLRLTWFLLLFVFGHQHQRGWHSTVEFFVFLSPPFLAADCVKLQWTSLQGKMKLLIGKTGDRFLIHINSISITYRAHYSWPWLWPWHSRLITADSDSDKTSLQLTQTLTFRNTSLTLIIQAQRGGACEPMAPGSELLKQEWKVWVNSWASQNFMASGCYWRFARTQQEKDYEI